MPEAPLSDRDDAALVKQAKSGDPQAFGILYQRYARNIYRFFCAQLPETLVAEDLTSDVFLRAWGALPRYRDRGFPFSAFLYKIARNALTDYRRKRSKEVSRSRGYVDSLPDENLKVGDQIIKLQAHQHLWLMLSEMRENYRSVLVLRFINGLPTREVSRILGKSEGSVRVLQHRALNVLREKMGRRAD